MRYFAKKIFKRSNIRFSKLNQLKLIYGNFINLLYIFFDSVFLLNIPRNAIQ